MGHPFRFGVTTSGAADGAAWQAKAQRVEALGYDTLLVPDHFMEQVATLPALAMAAAHTTRLRVGSIVCSNDFRHPILLAKEVATIDRLSGGRMELGLGAGWLKAEYDAIGLPFDPPGVRVGRLEEAVRLIKGYFTDPSLDFNGIHYQVKRSPGLDQTPLPAQRPHPPILIGAGGKRMLGIAAREADIIGLTIRVQADGSGPDPRDIAFTLAQKAAYARQVAGDRADTLEFHIQTWAVVVTDDREAAAAELARRFPLPPAMLLNIPFILIGSAAEIVDQLHAHRESIGLSYISVFDEYMESFAPIAAELAGN